VDDLHDKVAVVTGGASGIGFGLATALRAAGCRVVIADVEEAALEKAVAELEVGAAGRVHGVVTDVANLASVEALAASTLDRFGQVDVLCNNAGVSTFSTIEHLTIDDWKWVLGVDLWGVIHGVHVFLPIMVRQGTPAHIMSTASLAGLLSGTAQIGPYGVAKVGVVSISETLRIELAAAGRPIGVSVLCPGLTNTNVLDCDRNRPSEFGVEVATEAGETWRESMREGFAGPTGKEPIEVARMVVDAIRANRFWVISHGDLKPALERRFAEILDETPYEPRPTR
jgi:NAD(P)-dependent dehydrogenase (short-subunit alcohol dehydrogenase family)